MWYQIRELCHLCPLKVNQIEVLLQQNLPKLCTKVGTVELFEGLVREGGNGNKLASVDDLDTVTVRDYLSKVLHFLTSLQKCDQTDLMFLSNPAQQLKDPSRPAMSTEIREIGAQKKDSQGRTGWFRFQSELLETWFR